KGHRRAKIARQLVRNLDAAISATQLGITVASLGLGVLVEPVFNALLAPIYSGLKVESETVRHTAAILVGFLTNTYLLIVVGELAPKDLAIRKTLPVALWTTQPLVWFGRITYPFIWLFTRSTPKRLLLNAARSPRKPATRAFPSARAATSTRPSGSFTSRICMPPGSRHGAARICVRRVAS